MRVKQKRKELNTETVTWRISEDETVQGISAGAGRTLVRVEQKRKEPPAETDMWRTSEDKTVQGMKRWCRCRKDIGESRTEEEGADYRDGDVEDLRGRNCSGDEGCRCRAEDEGCRCRKVIGESKTEEEGVEYRDRYVEDLGGRNRPGDEGCRCRCRAGDEGCRCRWYRAGNKGCHRASCSAVQGMRAEVTSSMEETVNEMSGSYEDNNDIHILEGLTQSRAAVQVALFLVP